MLIESEIKTGFFIGLYDRGLGKKDREEIIRKQS